MRISTDTDPFNNNIYVPIWITLCAVGSLVGVYSSLSLQKGMLLAGALIFGCLMGPITPNMIVLSGGAQATYFVTLSLFWLVFAGMQLALFTKLVAELNQRESLSEQPPILGSMPGDEASVRVKIQPCGCEIDSSKMASAMTSLNAADQECDQ